VLNRNLQNFIAGYYQWKKNRPVEAHEPKFFDFMSFAPLMKAEKLFYQVGLTAAETIATLTEGVSNIESLGRFIAAHIYSVVLGNPDLLANTDFAASLDLETLAFDPGKMREHCSAFEMGNKTKMSMPSEFTKMAGDFLMQFQAAANHSEEKEHAEEHENRVAQPSSSSAASADD
jgi:hypothetical protein